MTDLPDIEEIKIALSAIEARDPATTSAERAGRDAEILRQMQIEVDNALGEDAPAGYASQDELRLVLGRINDLLEAHESPTSPS